MIDYEVKRECKNLGKRDRKEEEREREKKGPVLVLIHCSTWVTWMTGGELLMVGPHQHAEELRDAWCSQLLGKKTNKKHKHKSQRQTDLIILAIIRLTQCSVKNSGQGNLGLTDTHTLHKYALSIHLFPACGSLAWLVPETCFTFPVSSVLVKLTDVPNW